MWQPIETAPKDGIALGYLPYWRRPCLMAWFHDQWVDFTSFQGWGENNQPTHWMPIPDPPEVTEWIEVACSA